MISGNAARRAIFSRSLRDDVVPNAQQLPQSVVEKNRGGIVSGGSSGPGVGLGRTRRRVEREETWGRTDGDVLVARLGEVVDPVDVAPEETLGEIPTRVHALVRAWAGHALAPLKRRALGATGAGVEFSRRFPSGREARERGGVEAKDRRRRGAHRIDAARAQECERERREGEARHRRVVRDDARPRRR